MGAVKFAASVVRFSDWYYLLGICFFCFLDFPHAVNLSKAACSIGFCSIYLAWGYTFNNYYDQEEDSEQKNILKTIQNPSEKFAIVAGLTVLLFASAFLLGIWVETLIVMFLNFLYSHPAVRFKNDLVYSLFANSIFFGFLYYASMTILQPLFTHKKTQHQLYILLMFLPLQYVHFLEHEEFQRPIRPIKKTLIPFLLVIVVSIYSLLFVKNSAVPALTVFFSLGFMLIVVLNDSMARSRILIRYLSLLLGFGLLINEGWRYLA
jgi:4-hydroxybenzoate polyprenyltransferase